MPGFSLALASGPTGLYSGYQGWSCLFQVSPCHILDAHPQLLSSSYLFPLLSTWLQGPPQALPFLSSCSWAT